MISHSTNVCKCPSTRSSGNARQAFTLLEMLIVCAIIGLLASGVLFALQGVLEEGKVARTKTQIAKINEFVMERWESYRLRPVRIMLPMSKFDTSNPPVEHVMTGGEVARIRLAILREIMRYEMPDRITDIPTSSPGTLMITAKYKQKTNPVNGTSITDTFRPPDPALLREYRRKITAAAATSGTAWSIEHQSAECLYLILSSMRSDSGVATDFFPTAEIGDVDSDGMKEILDAWGKPIQFVRWAPGFSSRGENLIWEDGSGDDLVPSPSALQVDTVSATASVPPISPDPFDPLKTDFRWTDSISGNEPFLLVPLIFSAGRDGIYGITTNIPGLNFSSTTPPNDPYYAPGSGNGYPLGYPVIDPTDPGTYHDNIHNHLLDLR